MFKHQTVTKSAADYESAGHETRLIAWFRLAVAFWPVRTGIQEMKNSELQQIKSKSFARGMGNLYPVFAARARNAEVWDVEGKRYLDFGAGIAVVNTGHSHPHIVAALKRQLDAFSHTCIMITPYANAVELAERLCAVAPIKNARAMFLSTGAEAVENAIKIARAVTGRPGVIAFSGSFHGRTNLCMGLTGKVVPYKKGFGPFTPGIYHAPFPAEYLGVSADDSLSALQQLFKSDIEPEKVAAIIIEPVQGEGGFYPVPDGFLARLRALCDQHGILLVADEIQTGFGRTGRMFAIEYAGVEPDIITVAKGIAGGFPISAVVGRQAVMDGPEPGGLAAPASRPQLRGGLAALEVINGGVASAPVSRTPVADLRKLQAAHPTAPAYPRWRDGGDELVSDGDADKPDGPGEALCARATEAV
jgi:4-aminobutyrate aminotransferase/(S)-3-amino-2-methylpropionate transaminase